MAERGVASRGCGSQPQAREARDPARQALRPGCEELAERTLRRQCRRRKRGPRPKIATVERREACVPDRKGTRHASQAWWSRFAARPVGAVSALRSPFGEKGKGETRRPRAEFSGQAEHWLG